MNCFSTGNIPTLFTLESVRGKFLHRPSSKAKWFVLIKTLYYKATSFSPLPLGFVWKTLVMWFYRFQYYPQQTPITMNEKTAVSIFKIWFSGVKLRVLKTWSHRDILCTWANWGTILWLGCCIDFILAIGRPDHDSCVTWNLNYF